MKLIIQPTRLERMCSALFPHLKLCWAIIFCCAAVSTNWGCKPKVSGGLRGEAVSSTRDARAQPLFTDITERSGLAFKQSDGSCGQIYFVEQIASGASFIDANGDGYLDIYFPQPKELDKCKGKIKQPLKQRLYLNDGKGSYQLAKNAFGGSETAYGISAAVGDYDNDGDADIYVCCYGRNTMYQNRGDGTFQDVTQRAGTGLSGMSTSAAFFDYDADGHLDLYVARYCEWSPQKEIPCYSLSGKRDACNPLEYEPSSDVLYRNNGDGSFTDVTRKAGVGSQRRRGLGVAAADFNNDRRLDLFIANDLGANYLYINQGNGKFVDMAMQLSVAYGVDGRPQANMGIAVGDYNDNSRLDTVITTFTGEPYTLYRNDGDYFTDVSGSTGLFSATRAYLSFGTGFIDSTNQGRLDLFCANGHVSPHTHETHAEYSYKQRNQLLVYDGKGRFIDNLKALPKDNVRVHRGAAFGDINNDGKVDILVTAKDDRPTLLRNDANGSGNWLSLKLINKQGCVTPVGARCIATIGGKKKLRVVLGGGSYAGESDHRVHFGLGDATSVEKLEIQWMSGQKQVVEVVSANQILTIKEPDK
jgi:hypothetical protein